MESLRRQLEHANMMNIQSALTIQELSIERDCLKNKIVEIEASFRDMEEKFLRRIDDGMKEKESLLKEVKSFKAKNEMLEENLTLGFGYLKSIKESLMLVNEGVVQDHVCGAMNIYKSSFESERMMDFFMELDVVAQMSKRVDKKFGDELEETLLKGLVALDTINVSLMRILGVLNEQMLNVDEKSQELSHELKADICLKSDFIVKIAKKIEERMNCYNEKVVKEKRELENSVLSLTEENRDVSTLLRIAMVEKEEVEKKLKGNNEQKSSSLLQLFGFMMGGGGGDTNEQSEVEKKDSERISENMSSDTSIVSDITGECEEEVGLVSTVEKMMKSLRLDISQLRRALQESRSDTARLQSFVKKQTEQIREQKVYIKELEDEGRILSGKVEQLLIEMKATEEDAERWREACELEVDAGKRVVEERDKVIDILKQEIEKTNSSLKASNNKLKSKEELAVAAMAAQSAAEKSVQLADIRAAGLQRRIEELTKQLENVERLKNKHGHKARRSCCPWPWPWLRLPLRFDSPDNVRRAGARNGDIRRVLPEMEALLNHNVLL